jgi:hypothetical protein
MGLEPGESLRPSIQFLLKEIKRQRDAEQSRSPTPEQLEEIRSLV